MKAIVAFVRRRMLGDVLEVLQDIDGLTGVSLVDIKGFGRGRAHGAEEATETDGFLLAPKVRIEIFCASALVDEVVRSIKTAAHTGLRGDGKVYVVDVENSVRISTGEIGDEAI